MLNTLTTLYPDITSARRVAHDASLDTSDIALDGSANDCWQAILSAAEEQGRTFALLAVAAKEYPAAVERGIGGWPDGLLVSLRDRLANIYSDKEEARRVAQECALPYLQISFSSNAKNTWHDVLTKAGFYGEIHKLLPYASAEATSLHGRVRCAHCTAVYAAEECPKCGAPRPVVA